MRIIEHITTGLKIAACIAAIPLIMIVAAGMALIGIAGALSDELKPSTRYG